MVWSGTVGLMARAVNCAADRPAERWAMAAEGERDGAIWRAHRQRVSHRRFLWGGRGMDRPPVEFPEPLNSSAAVPDDHRRPGRDQSD